MKRRVYWGSQLKWWQREWGSWSHCTLYFHLGRHSSLWGWHCHLHSDSSAFLETLLQTHPEMCFHNDFKSSQVDNDHHTHYMDTSMTRFLWQSNKSAYNTGGTSEKLTVTYYSYHWREFLFKLMICSQKSALQSTESVIPGGWCSISTASSTHKSPLNFNPSLEKFPTMTLQKNVPLWSKRKSTMFYN